jgi:undecaprenyl-diphosphatase
VSDRIHPPAAVLGLVVFGFLAVGLSFAAAGDGVLAGDLRVARRIQTFDGRIGDAIAAFGNGIGSYRIGAAITLPIVAVLGWHRRWREMALLLAILAVRALNNTIKGLIDSPRPAADVVRVSEEAHGLGFPSGHAMGSTLLFGALAVLAWRKQRLGRFRFAAVGASALIVVATGFGRIQTGVHWPSDVLGGMLYGAALLLALLVLFRLATTSPRASDIERRQTGIGHSSGFSSFLTPDA